MKEIKVRLTFTEEMLGMARQYKVTQRAAKAWLSTVMLRIVKRRRGRAMFSEVSSRNAMVEQWQGKMRCSIVMFGKAMAGRSSVT